MVRPILIYPGRDEAPGACGAGGFWMSLAMKPANVKACQWDDLNRMGSYIAPMAQSDVDAGADEMSYGDLETARLYGSCVSEIAARLATVPTP